MTFFDQSESSTRVLKGVKSSLHHHFSKVHLKVNMEKTPVAHKQTLYSFAPRKAKPSISRLRYQGLEILMTKLWLGTTPISPQEKCEVVKEEPNWLELKPKKLKFD